MGKLIPAQNSGQAVEATAATGPPQSKGGKNGTFTFKPLDAQELLQYCEQAGGLAIFPPPPHNLDNSDTNRKKNKEISYVFFSWFSAQINR